MMSSEKCFVIFSQTRHIPLLPCSLIAEQCPWEKSNADGLQAGSTCLKPHSSARAPRGHSTQQPVMDGLLW